MPRILEGVFPVEVSQKCLNYCLRSQGVQVVVPALRAVTPAKLPWRLSESWRDSDEALVASAESSAAACACCCGILHAHVLSRFVVGVQMLSTRFGEQCREIVLALLSLPGGRICASVMERREATGTRVGQDRDLRICAALKSTSEMKNMLF